MLLPQPVSHSNTSKVCRDKTGSPQYPVYRALQVRHACMQGYFIFPHCAPDLHDKQRIWAFRIRKQVWLGYT